jgi:putative endopeptidase
MVKLAPFDADPRPLQGGEGAGGIGVLAAHELTHGFDAVGSKFDKGGNVSDWWSTDDRKQFDEAASCEVPQLSEGVPKAAGTVARTHQQHAVEGGSMTLSTCVRSGRQMSASA